WRWWLRWRAWTMVLKPATARGSGEVGGGFVDAVGSSFVDGGYVLALRATAATAVVRLRRTSPAAQPMSAVEATVVQVSRLSSRVARGDPQRTTMPSGMKARPAVAGLRPDACWSRSSPM